MYLLEGQTYLTEVKDRGPKIRIFDVFYFPLDSNKQLEKYFN